MNNLLYPWYWIYYDMAEGDEGEGGGGEDPAGGGDPDAPLENGGEDIEYAADVLADQEDVQIVPLEIETIDVSNIGRKIY
jgi:hypothetical protein